MPESDQKNTDPTIFGRGSLQLSFNLLRKKDPKLALQIRNITAGTPLDKTGDQLENKHSDFFKVDLDSHQVRAIVEILSKEVQLSGSEPQDAGRMIVTKSLIDDWMALANKMLSDHNQAADI